MSGIPPLLIVMTGGAIGAGARFGVGQLVGQLTGAALWATLAVNLIGGGLMGVLAGLVARGTVTDAGRLFLGVGILGGFTTFSAFGLDAVRLLTTGQAAAALAYVAASVGGAIALTIVMYQLTQLVRG